MVGVEEQIILALTTIHLLVVVVILVVLVVVEQELEVLGNFRQYLAVISVTVL